MYTLWISLPTENAAGDITITDGKGKFYSFFYGVGAESPSRLELLNQWMQALPFQLNMYDKSCIERAVIDNYVVSDTGKRRAFTR